MRRVGVLIRCFMALTMLAAAPLASGQGFPTKPIRLVVSFPPGAGTDLIARVIANDLQELVGQPVVVENKPGAAGNIAAEFVARAANDGHTLLVVNSTFAANVGLFPKLPFDPIKDFAPVTVVGGSPLVIAANQASGINSLNDMVTAAKAKPGSLSYASCGNGGPPHIIGEQFMKTQGIDVTHIPYKGCGPATADVVGGQVPILFTNISSTLPFLASGKLKALAVTLPKRSPLAPTIPTVGELGLGNFDVDLWFGIVAPAGTPSGVIDKLNKDIAKVLSQPTARDKLRAQNVEPRTTTPQEFDAFMKAEITRYSGLIREFKIKVD